MYSAIYYPFTGPESGSFLKTALFLWDSVDFIVPYRGFQPRGSTPDECEALEIVGRNYVPTEADKKSAHAELEDFCTGPLSDKLAFTLDRPERPYDFYPEKLLDETWRMLSESRLAAIVNGDGTVRRASTSPLFGYYMMSILAVCCAQGRKPLVTDQNDPYRALANILVDSILTEHESCEDWHGRLIALTLSGPDFERTSLRKLIDLRKSEDKLLQDLRRTFVQAVDTTAAEICKNADNVNTVRELIETFTKDTEKDLKEMKLALWGSAGGLLLSKEFGFSVLAATTTAVAMAIPATASLAPIPAIATMGGLTKGLLEYRDRRHKILRAHPSSWLFVAGGRKIPVV